MRLLIVQMLYHVKEDRLIDISIARFDELYTPLVSFAFDWTTGIGAVALSATLVVFDVSNKIGPLNEDRVPKAIKVFNIRDLWSPREKWYGHYTSCDIVVRGKIVWVVLAYSLNISIVATVSCINEIVIENRQAVPFPHHKRVQHAINTADCIVAITNNITR